MAFQRPCPRCSSPIEIPQPLPARVQCSQCGAVIKLKGGSADHEVVSASPAMTAAVALGPGQPVISASAELVHAIAAGLPPSAMLPDAVPVLPAAEPAAASRKKWVLWGSGAVAILAVGIFLIVWAFSGGEDHNKKNDPGAEIKSPNDVVFKPLPLPPPDPRIKVVQPAVDKGVAFLKASVSKLPAGMVLPGHPAAHAGLIGLALLECGVPPDDPGILQIAEIIRKEAPGLNPVYDLSASLFFLNRWDESRSLSEKDRNMARSFALRIIAAQGSNGIWAYTGVVMTPEQETKLLTSLGQRNYKPSFPTGGQSMSNTQFAMLAVWGSRKHGVPVREPLLALAGYFHANQGADGHWTYPAHSLKATSTSAGLIALAVERVLLEDQEFASKEQKADDGKKKKADVDKAFAFVAKTIGRKMGDPGAPAQYGGGLFNADAIGDLYFLWTLERVGVIYSKELIGGKNWYDWGYPIVMQAQNPDGSWNERHSYPFGPLIDTSLALLFLKRANIAKDLTDKLRLLGGDAAVQSSPSNAPLPSPGRKE